MNDTHDDQIIDFLTHARDDMFLAEMTAKQAHDWISADHCRMVRLQIEASVAQREKNRKQRK